MGPEDEREHCDNKPACPFVSSAFSENEEKKRTAQKDRASKWIEPEIWESGTVPEALEQHFVHVPWNGMQREQPMLIPRFAKHARDPGVSKIEERTKPREVISRS
jgi:hypothetical protein